jgi:hypothetical protein
MSDTDDVVFSAVDGRTRSLAPADAGTAIDPANKSVAAPIRASVSFVPVRSFIVALLLPGFNAGHVREFENADGSNRRSWPRKASRKENGRG